jgi:hypothetical protein
MKLGYNGATTMTSPFESDVQIARAAPAWGRFRALEVGPGQRASNEVGGLALCV